MKTKVEIREGDVSFLVIITLSNGLTFASPIYAGLTFADMDSLQRDLHIIKAIQETAEALLRIHNAKITLPGTTYA